MTESRKLPIRSFLPHFRELLGGMVLGRYAIREGIVKGGSLRAWVPDDVDAIRPEDIWWDIFYPGPDQPAPIVLTSLPQEEMPRHTGYVGPETMRTLGSRLHQRYDVSSNAPTRIWSVRPISYIGPTQRHGGLH
jgi:hypothetical protein